MILEIQSNCKRKKKKEKETRYEENDTKNR